jgi:putative ATP-binding cassette transporter
LFAIEPNVFISIFGFCVFGTIVTFVIGKTLVSLNFTMLQKEDYLRYSLVGIQDNAENIAYFSGEAIEAYQVGRRLDKVSANAKDIIGTQRNLDDFMSLYAYLAWLLPVVDVAPEYFASNVDLGVVQQSATAFAHILDDLSIVITKSEL